MATRIAARYASRRFSTSGKILSEEEKAAENVYIKHVELIKGVTTFLSSRGENLIKKKMEQEKLDKLARKGPNEAATTNSGAGSVTNAKPASGASSAEKISTDKYRNYAVLAGSITALGAIGWYIKGTAKKPEVQD